MSIEITRLDSGLTVATDGMASVDTVSLGAWVGVGTRHEPAEVNGIAHLLEHMAFKGTERRTAQQIAEEIEAVGGHLNAYTSRENTAYYAKVLVEDTALAVDVIADILQNSTFDEDELTRERAVVLQEIGQALDTPDDIIFDHFQETAFPGQALGRPVLGRADIVAALDRQRLHHYMSHNYNPKRMIFTAAGRLEHERIVDLVSAAFAGITANGSATPEPAAYRGGDFREERDLEQVHLLLGFEAIGYCDPDYYPGLALATLLGGGMSSRLFQEVREKRGLVYSIYSFLSAYADGGLFGIYAGTGQAEVEELIPVVCDQFAGLADGIGEDELARTKAQLKASILMGRESSGSRAEQLAQQLLAYGRPIPVDEIIGKIEAVDAGSLTNLAARLAATRPTLASLGPVAQVESFDRLAGRLS